MLKRNRSASANPRHDRWFTFRIHEPRPGIAVDDLVGAELAALSIFIVADKPTQPEHLLIVMTNDSSIVPERILAILNGRFNLNAEFVEEKEATDEAPQ